MGPLNELPGEDTAKSGMDFALLRDRARAASDLLKAMSHETRLLVLCLLVDGERSVSELEALLALPQATISQQLARLRDDDLVATRRDGRMIYYRIARPDVARLIGTLYELFCGPAATDR